MVYFGNAYTCVCAEVNIVEGVDAILNCDSEVSVCSSGSSNCMHLPIVVSMIFGMEAIIYLME